MRDRYIPGVPCWLDSSHPDPAAAGEFYAGLFGWEVEDVMPPGAPAPYLIGRIGGKDVAALGPLREGAPATAFWNTYVWVQSADETAEKVRAAGGTVLHEPFDVQGAGRLAVCADPAGAVFNLWQAGEHRGSQVVNEHGSVNFNTLHTDDLEAARAFYGAVFGWQVMELGDGAMWTLPGYGQFLDELRPGTLDGMKSMGAPEGFENVVAAVAAGAEAAPHWSVTFAVDDADAAAARARELGGRVVVEPADAPWVRTCVLADPQGATFFANQFVLENRDLPAGAGAANGG